MTGPHGCPRCCAAQIEQFRPDIVLTHSLTDLPTTFWTSMRSHFRLLVGQIASPLADDIDLSPFDLMLSSLPNFVARFRSAGLRAEPFRLAFDPSVLARLEESDGDRTSLRSTCRLSAVFHRTIRAATRGSSGCAAKCRSKSGGRGSIPLPAASPSSQRLSRACMGHRDVSPAGSFSDFSQLSHRAGRILRQQHAPV